MTFTNAGNDGIEKVQVAIKNDLDDFMFRKTKKMLHLSVYITSLMKEYRRESFHALFDITTDFFTTPL